jgi:hypothetical protein
VWLDSHALTLENYTGNYYLGNKYSSLRACLIYKPGIHRKVFMSNSVIILKKVNLIAWQTCQDISSIAGKPAAYRVKKPSLVFNKSFCVVIFVLSCLILVP